MNTIGTLTKVSDLREGWPREAQDFTKWLAENLSLLGQEIGVDLELRAMEHPVGKYRLDILAHDVNNNKIVAIENQLETSDHTHLGQLITYAAGVDKSGIGIWICKNITDQHIAALEWLNALPDWDFFGIEIKLFKIEGSPLAPYFDIIVKPNQWKRVAGQEGSGKISDRGQLYQEFWQKLLESFKSKYSGITNASKGPAYSWCAIPSGYTGLAFQWAFKTNDRFIIELYIDFNSERDQNKRKEKNESFFTKLKERQEAIESTIGCELSWELLPNYTSCRIGLERNQVNILSVPDDLLSYATDNMKKFRDAFKSEIDGIILEMNSE